jgi:hypothetical protein
MKSSKPIILIGPMSAGKSTVATHIARMINIPNVPMDRVRWYYYFKDGFSLERELSCSSFAETLIYWKPFEVKAVRRIIAEFPDSIIDFGAGHSYFTDPDQFSEVQSLLSPFPNIFLLMPSIDKELSIEICNKRLSEKKKMALDQNEIDANRNFIMHESNYRLAKHIVYTAERTPEDVAKEIIGLLV